MVGIHTAKQSGYIALITVLIVGAAATAIVTALLLTGVDSQRTSVVLQKTRQARALAVTCAEEASQQIHDNVAFTGTAVVPLGQGTCTYVVTKTTPTTRFITATATVGTIIRKLSTTATINAATVTLASWKEAGTIIMPATPAFVQIKTTTSASNVSTIATTMSTEVAGNLNVVVIGWDDVTASISSVADNAGNTYTLAAPITRGTGLSEAMYYAKNIVAGAPIVTVTFSAAVTLPDLRVLEYSGADAISPFDTTSSNVGLNNPSTAGSLTTGFATALIVSGGQTSNAYTTPGAGYTMRGVTTHGDMVEDQVVTAIGPYNATAPGSGNWVQQAVSFRAAGQ